MNPSQTLRSGFGLLAALLVLATAAPAFAAEFFLGTSEADSRLFRVETSTGATTLIGATGVPFLSDIAVDSVGNLYGTNGTRLYSINTTTGAATILGTSAFSNVFFVAGLEFDTTGQLWGVDTSINTVVTISPIDGSDTFEFSTGWAFDSGLAYSTGDIHYSSGPFLGTRHLIELDMVAQTATDKGLIASGLSPTAMDFDGSGTLFVFDGPTGDIYEITDPATSSTGVFVSSTSFGTISGVTFLASGTQLPTLPLAAAIGLGIALGLFSAFHVRRSF